MKRGNFYLLSVLFLTLGACKMTQSGAAMATAEILNGKEEKIGTATFHETSSGVEIVVDVWSLPPGTHAIHLHEVGECHGPDFKSSKGHFNPYGKKHGAKNPDGPHAGDLENFEVGNDGKAHFTRMAKLVTLKEGVVNSLFQPGGTCILIHEKADDYATDPTGNAGSRLACGMIVKK